MRSRFGSVPACLVAAAGALLAFTGYTASPALPPVQNLLAPQDLNSPSGWGTPISIPQDTGQFVVEGGKLSMLRQRPGGDFKVYNMVEKLPPKTDFALRFQVKIEGPGTAQINVLQRPPGGDWVSSIPSQNLPATEGWRAVDIRFTTPPEPRPICLQFSPPSQVGAKLALGPLLLVRASALDAAGGDEETYPCFRLSQAPKIDG